MMMMMMMMMMMLVMIESDRLLQDLPSLDGAQVNDFEHKLLYFYCYFFCYMYYKRIITISKIIVGYNDYYLSYYTFL